ncbi:5'-methylthioadenosine/S-adenosylhomocysteine nucleosidase [Rothia sp. ZJ932]|nr:5'-methylthioadenosine/S-adenosylhomocysteine nucleosidase [Rothia sp. ZJ1223]QRZ62625.1 5'-methylthioadenosine/S-adenosylhomocysteine nucleosidase [Rothia sp. ZJ932]
MDAEAAPFLEASASAGEDFSVGVAHFYPRVLETENGPVPFILVRSMIGLVNAATALTVALELVPSPSVIVSAGTAGGLRQDINVGDLAVGVDYTYTDADATAFGYARGQVPGMPEKFGSPAQLISLAHEVADGYKGEGTVFFDTMLAGGSFVTAHNVADTREVFPQAISTDMETTALAQVCSTRSLPFIATRGISDLCGPAADQDFHMATDIVSQRSANFVLALVTRVRDGRTEAGAANA